MTSKVVIERCRSYSAEEVRSAIKEALAPLGGIASFVHAGQKVLLKPNLLFPSAADDAVTTHPVFVQEVSRLVLEAGGKPFIGDSPGFGSAKQVARKSGLLEAAEKLGIEVVEFTHPVSAGLSRLPSLAGVTVDRMALDTDIVINLPKIKSHAQVVFTGAVKNMFGCVNGKRKAFRHLILGSRDAQFGKMLVQIYSLVSPALTIMDGVTAMEGAGPRKGKPRHLGLIMAGADGIALDMVLKEILGAPEDPPYLTSAREMGLGPRGLDGIHVEGCSIEDVKIKNFVFPDLEPITFNPFRVIKSVTKDLLMKQLFRGNDPTG